MNHGRKIRSLAEDFAALGLISEDEAIDEMEAGPDRGAQRKAEMLRKKQARAQAMLAKKQARAKAQVSSEDWDIEDDFDGDDLDEGRMAKIKKATGAAAIKSRQAAKKYYKRKKAKIARGRKKLRKTAGFKKKAKYFSKHKARKGYRRSFPGGAAYESIMDELGNSIDSLRFDGPSDQIGEAFHGVARLAAVTARNYDALSEDYASLDGDYAVVSAACEAISLEAQAYAEALAEHHGSIRSADQDLLKEHLEELAEEIGNLAELADDILGLIAEADGEVDDDYDDELDEAYEEYGESPYVGPKAMWKNSELHIVGNVMHPLGWDQGDSTSLGIKRLSTAEKELRPRSGGLGYGLHLDSGRTRSFGY